MTVLQRILIGTAIFLTLGLYFGFNTKSPDYGTIEKQRSLAASTTNIGSLLIEAKPTLDKQQAAYVLSLEKQLQEAKVDSLRATAYKGLSSKWYEYGRADISGYYAEQVAQIEKTEQAWSIAGTTFMIGSRVAEAEKNKKYCMTRAVNAFENAISLNPDNIGHKLNLATCYAENPPAENPMKGIMMMLDLNKTYPENVSILLSIAKFGIQTGQYEKASERLNKAISLDSDNAQAYCLLAEALFGLGKKTEATTAEEKCASLQKLPE